MTGLLLTSSGTALLVGGLAQLAVPAGEITVRTQQQSLGVAPHAVTFEVDGWAGWDTATSVDSTAYNPCMHDLVYLWDFDDPTSPAFTAQNVLSQWTDSNKAYGYAAAHVYRTPGTYYPSCLVIEPSSGKSYTWTHPTGITVADPDTFFTDANTFWVDHTATYTGKPAAATGYTTLLAAMNALTGRSDPTRIVIANGHTETGFTYGAPNGQGAADGTGYLANHSNGIRNYYITMVDGYTTRAEITCSGDAFGSFNAVRLVPRTSGQLIDFVMEGINFTGPWDPVRLEGDYTVGGFEFAGSFTIDESGPPDGILLLDCKVRGFSGPFSAGTSAVAIDDGTQVKTPRNQRLVVLCNTELSGGHERVYAGDGTKDPIGTGERQTWAWLGLQMADGADDTDGWAAAADEYDHGAAHQRGGVRTLIVDGSSLYSGIGRVFTPQNGTADWTGGKQWIFTTRQPCMRFGLDATHGECRANIQRSYFEGKISIAGHNDNAQPADQNILIEKSLLIPGITEYEGIVIRGNGVTIRNNVLLWPNYGLATSAGFKWFVFRAAATTDDGLTFGNINVEYNSIVGFSTIFSPSLSTESSNVTWGYTLSNNLRHEPNSTPAITTYAPVALSGSAITPFCDGANPGAELYEGVVSDYSDQGDGIVENGETMTIPYSEGDSSYFRTGSAAAHYVKIAGTTRSATYSWGASSVTITNTSGVTWNATDAVFAVFGRDPDHYPPKVTTWAAPAGTVGIYAPTAGSSAIGGGTTSFPRFDILGANRKTIIDGLTRTNATLGAVEVNLES